jgi:hypothetical protein
MRDATQRGVPLAACAALLSLPLTPGTTEAQEGGQQQNVTLNGTLVLPEGERPGDWRVAVGPRLLAELTPEAETRASAAKLNADGTFSLQAAGSGQQYVCAYAGGKLDVDSVVPIRLTQSGEAPKDLKLSPKAARAQVAFVLEQDDGSPLGRKVKVHLYNVHGEIGAPGMQSDESGVVKLERLPSTRYDLWVEGPADPSRSAGQPLAAILFDSLDITPGSEVQTFELKVPQAAAAKGRLLLADGKTPAKGYVVATQSGTVADQGASVERWPAAYARGARGGYAEATVAADGSFTLTGLTPGEQAFDLRPQGEREPWSTLTGVAVGAGGTADLGTVVVARNGWQRLFDRRSLDGWKEGDFWGKKEVRIENDRVVLTMGNDMTGITWTRELPRVDYEVTLQGMRVAGDDFFCGLTFPVKKDPCSMVLGGWGGGVVGLSSLDGFDASENETSQYVKFENQRWYRIRLKVRQEKIQAWVDTEKLIDVDLEGKTLSIRLECEPSVPFGFATWRTTGALRDIRIRRLDPGEG